ncbi:Uncharacterised protein [Mycobacterium tuberculosis]|nr:Uncharacterised protein [Mycobacterium tuberculosis]
MRASIHDQASPRKCSGVWTCSRLDVSDEGSEIVIARAYDPLEFEVEVAKREWSATPGAE